MYREDISNFLDEGILYIPKNGGLKDYVQRLLPEIGVEANGQINNGKLELRTARGEDIAMRVEDCLKQGSPAYGLSGDDLFDEYMLKTNAPLTVLNTYDWFDKEAEFYRPALCLMSKNKTQNPRVALNAKYKETSKMFLDSRFDNYCIRTYAGDTESTVAQGSNDACIDIVYSGRARKEAGLNIDEMVRFSDISLIGGNKEETFDFKLDYGKRGGLLPAITQDITTMEVLMLGYANPEALEKTIESGYAAFYSTSRQELWTKGETSGAKMKIAKIMTDCDQDALLYMVEPTKGACHTTDARGNKRTSCFYRTIYVNEG